jgi:plasmid stability protein
LIFWRCLLASLTISQLDDDTCERLRVRAIQNGVSIEEEARQIITRVVSAPERIGDLFREIFGSAEVSDLELPLRAPHDPVDLEDERSLEETAYLLRSPKNAKRLTEAIAEFERGGTEPE